LTAIIITQGWIKPRSFTWLILISFIFLLITIGTTSFYQFPPSALYYVKSLPIYYWAGIGVTLFAVVLSYKIKINDKVKLIPHLLLAAYLFALPSFTYENPRFMDVYDHGTGALWILNRGEIGIDHSYSKDYPLAFILMASTLLITNTNPAAFLQLYQAFLPLLMIVLIYVLARGLNPKYALYTPLAFNAILFQDQGHFSPQSLALALYVILWLYLIRTWLNKDNNRETVIITVITLLAINMSNPTTSYFLLTNLVTLLLLSMLLFRRLVSAKYNTKILPVFLIHVIVVFAWSIYGAEGLGISKIVDKIEDDLNRSAHSTYALPLNPDSSYVGVVVTNAIETLFIIISSIVFFIFLFKYSKHEMKTLTIIFGLIVGSLIVTPLALFQSGTYVERVLMFTAIPWSILFASFMTAEIKNKWYTGFRTAAFAMLFVFILLIPISKYGSEPTTYFSSSEIYLADSLTKNSTDSTVLTLRTGKHIFEYFGAYNNNEVKTGQIVPKFSVIDQRLFEEKLDAKIHQEENLKVALTNMERNVYSLKYVSDEDVYMDYLQERFNLVANNGAQIYSAPP